MSKSGRKPSLDACIISALNEHGALTQTEIAEKTGFRAGSISRALDRLCSAHTVERIETDALTKCRKQERRYQIVPGCTSASGINMRKFDPDYPTVQRVPMAAWQGTGAQRDMLVCAIFGQVGRMGL